MSWTSDQPIISLKEVRKSFGELEVLKGVSFDVMKGEVICIIGPSGSGKSTLIRCVNALNDIQSGSITVEGIEVNDPRLDKLALRKKVGMVFQQYNLFPHKTAIENVMMAPLKVLKQPRAEVEERALVSRLYALIQDGLIAPVGAGRFVFAHDRLRDAAYAMLEPDRRHRLRGNQGETARQAEIRRRVGTKHAEYEAHHTEGTDLDDGHRVQQSRHGRRRNHRPGKPAVQRYQRCLNSHTGGKQRKDCHQCRCLSVDERRDDAARLELQGTGDAV